MIFIVYRRYTHLYNGIRLLFLGNPNRIFNEDGKLRNLLLSLLAYKKEMRYMAADFILNLMRGLMSYANLNLPCSKSIGPLFNAVLGIATSSMSIENIFESGERRDLEKHLVPSNRKLSDNIIL